MISYKYVRFTERYEKKQIILYALRLSHFILALVFLYNMFFLHMFSINFKIPSRSKYKPTDITANFLVFIICFFLNLRT